MTLYSGADALVWYRTVDVADDPQPSVVDSRGGYASSTRVRGRSFLASAGIPDVRIDHVSPAVPLGDAVLTAVDANGLTFTASGGTPGERVELLDGETKTIVGDTPEHYVNARRISATAMAGAFNLTIRGELNNVLAGQNIPWDQAGPGRQRYRALMLVNKSPLPITDLRIWQPAIGTPQTSSGGGLAPDRCRHDRVRRFE